MAWVSDRKDLLLFLFGVCMLGAYVRYARTLRWGYLALAFVLFLLATLSKGMSVALVPSLLAIDLYLGRDLRRARPWLEKLPFFVLGVAAGLLAIHAQAQTDAIQSAPDHPLPHRLIMAAANLAVYWGQCLVPVGLNPRYSYPPTGEGVPAWAWFAACAFLAATVLVWRARRKALLLFAVLFFTLNLALVLQVLPVGNALRADRYTYLAGIGPTLLLAAGVLGAVAQGGWKRWAVPLLVLPYLLWTGWAARQQTGIWRDALALWDEMVRCNPKDATMRATRAAYHAERKQHEQAIADYSRALALDNRLMLARFDRAREYVLTRQYTKAMDDYLVVYQSKIKAPPLLLQSMIYTVMKMGRYGEAVTNADAALKLDSTATTIRNIKAYSLYKLGRLDAAHAELDRVYAKDPADPMALYIDGLSLLAVNDTSGACDRLRRSLEQEISEPDMAQERAETAQRACRIAHTPGTDPSE